MPKYIDIENFSQMVQENSGRDGEFNYRDLIGILSEQPTADVKEVVYGKWKNNWISTDEDLNGYYDGNFQCSECFEVSEEPTDFCPNCGADMRELEEND